MRIEFRDIVAVVILGALFYCKIVGLDGVIDAMIALIIGYYFSKRIYEYKNDKKNLK